VVPLSETLRTQRLSTWASFIDSNEIIELKDRRSDMPRLIGLNSMEISLDAGVWLLVDCE